MRRAVIIGVGGTGVRTIRHVRDIIRWKHNAALPQVPFVSVLGLDTSLDSGEQEGPDFIHIRVGQHDVQQALKAHQAGRLQWMDPGIIGGAGTIEDGAGAVRMIGKFAFLHDANYRQFLQFLAQKIEAVKPHTQAGALFGNAPVTGRIKIYVVGNLVSGTGSGASVDCAYAVRKMITGEDLLGLPFELTGVFTLPDRVQDLLHAANCYHALQELNHHMSDGVGYRVDDPLQPGEMITVSAEHRPFDFAYLVGTQGRSQDEQIPGHQALERLIGEWIYTDVFLPMAEMRDGRRDDTRQYFTRPDDFGFFPRFFSFGLSTIEYPSPQIARGCTYRFVTEAVNRWLNMGGTDDTEGRRPWASRSYAPREPGDQDLVDYGSQLRSLGMGPGDFTATGSTDSALVAEVRIQDQPVNLVFLYRQLLAAAVANYNGDLEALERVEKVILAGFDGKWSERSQAGSFAAGIVPHVLDMNTQQLTEGFPSQMRQAIAAVTFGEPESEAYGPLHARKLLRRLAARLDELQQAAGMIPTDALTTAVEDAKRNLDLIEADFLLVSPFDFMRRLARARAIQTYEEAARGLFDAKLTNLLRRRGPGLAASLRSSVDQMAGRLENFLTYLQEGVRLQCIERYERECEAVWVNGVDLLEGNPEAEIRSVYENSVTNVNRNSLIDGFLHGLSQPPSRGRLSLDLCPDQEQASPFDDDMPRLKAKEAKPGEPRYRLPREYEEELVAAPRVRFVEATRSKNVVTLFGPPDDPAQLRTTDLKANLFLPANFAAVGYRVDERRMFKEYYFYPGGGQVQAAPADQPPSNAVPEQRFAWALQQALGGLDWAAESWNSDDPHLIMILKERGAFPVRLLTSLEAMGREGRRTDLTPAGEYTANWNVRNPLASRVDMDFQPLSVTDRKDLIGAQNTFLAAVAVGVLRFVPERGVFVVAGEDEGLPIGARETWSLPPRPRTAAYRLHRQRALCDRLTEGVREYRKGTGDPDHEMVREIYKLLENPRERNLDVSASRDDLERLNMNRTMLIEYIKPDPGLLRAWTDLQLRPDLMQFRSPVTYHRAGDEKGRFPVRGFYCDDCGSWRGDPVGPDGEPDAAQLPDNCISCALRAR